MADDLIDDSKSAEHAREWIAKLEEFLHLSFSESKPEVVTLFVRDNFPTDYQHALLSLPTAYLSPGPLCFLLKGFDMDLGFFTSGQQAERCESVIKNEEDLAVYSLCVAGTVAELCLDIAFHHSGSSISVEDRVALKKAGQSMGSALQYVNIARDVTVDASINRVYLPDTWLHSESLTAEAVLKNPLAAEVGHLRVRLLRNAFAYYATSKESMELLPGEIRGPMRVAVDSYMEIGRTLLKMSPDFRAGRVKVPRPRRLFVAWRAMWTAKSF